ncbi:MAG TPA: hypothetical protein PLI09_23760 [Candidatus Hydrogenedentes bacterium]|nr:hypothetical protein [Candidatus Hydrogenedentota bacterium]
MNRIKCWHIIGYGLFIAGVYFSEPGLPQSTAHAAPAFAGGVSQGSFAPPDNETSGMAASFTSPGILWVHGDSDGGPNVYALDYSGNLLATYSLTNATFTDCEDAAAGPGPVSGVSYLYIGDIGDNEAERSSIRVYRFPEPVVYTHWANAMVSVPESTWEVINFVYPGIPSLRECNAESLMVDPRNGDLYIATKESDPAQSRVFYAAAASLVDGGLVSLTLVRSLSDLENATSACISPQGTELILRGTSWAWLWQIGAEQSVAEALAGTKVGIPLASEEQGEAAAFEKNGSGYLTVSEGSPVEFWYFSRTSSDGPTPEHTVIPIESDWRYLDDGSDQGIAWRTQEFDDTAWPNGPAQLGYGEGDEQTVVSYGDNPSQKHVTTYFRKTFTLDAGVTFDTLLMRILYEGGVAVYVNGAEVLRQNLVSEASSSTLATGTRGATKYAWLTINLDTSLLVNGVNIVAAEVHLADRNQASLSFDFQLEGALPLYALTVTENNPGWGVVSVQPSPNASDGTRYLSGTEVTLIATPYHGFSLEYWLVFDVSHPGDPLYATEAYGNTLLLTMSSNREVQAVWREAIGEGQGEGEGENEALQCPQSSIFSQPSVGPEEAWTTITSSADTSYYAVERFSNLEQPARYIQWWAFNQYYDGSAWSNCIMDSDEIIVTVYEDNAGIPGAVINTASITPVKTDTGLLFGTRPLYRYEANLPFDISAATGWISVKSTNNPECWMLWMISGLGDGSCMKWQGTSYITQAHDLSLCLSPETGEGSIEGEGGIEGEGQEEGIPSEGMPEEGEGAEEGENNFLTADQNQDGAINLSELLRVIQFFNSDGFHCEMSTEDGYAPGPGEQTCVPHDSDYNPQDWHIGLSELLRAIQFFNSNGYHACPGEGTEDGFCPGTI